jgi:hypothetical protein
MTFDTMTDAKKAGATFDRCHFVDADAMMMPGR